MSIADIRETNFSFTLVELLVMISNFEFLYGSRTHIICHLDSIVFSKTAANWTLSRQ